MRLRTKSDRFRYETNKTIQEIDMFPTLYMDFTSIEKILKKEFCTKTYITHYIKKMEEAKQEYIEYLRRQLIFYDKTPVEVVQKVIAIEWCKQVLQKERERIING